MFQTELQIDSKKDNIDCQNILFHPAKYIEGFIDLISKFEIHPQKNYSKLYFEDLTKISQGGQSIVYRGIFKQDRTAYILKKIPMGTKNLEQLKKLALWEPFLLSKCNHVNILKFFDFWSEQQKIRVKNLKDGQNQKIEYSTNLWLMTELCDETLENFLIRRNKELQNIESPIQHDKLLKAYQIQSLDYMIQIISGLKYMHSKMHLVHRDLKPSNIFLTSTGIIKIGDFGLARPTNIKLSDEDLNTFTILYGSPEQKQKINSLDEKSDIYSLGIILLELIQPMMTSMEMIRNIKKCKEKNYDDFDSQFRNIIGMISECLELNKDDRPNLEEIEKTIQDHINQNLSENFKAITFPENICFANCSFSTFVENDNQ